MGNRARNLVALSALAVLAIPAFAAGPNGKPVTFAKDVAPILQAKCQECHRAGTVAPMSLITYQETRPWARSIKERVITRNMPPWHLDKNVGVQHFQNDRSLSDEQIKTIVSWVDAGAPQGNPKDMPPPIQWPVDERWQLAKEFGEPDLVVKSAPYAMPAQGQDIWWKPATPVNISEPRWVRAVEMRPGTTAGRKITHHALARLEQDEPADDDPANSPGLFMEWAVGKQYDVFRANTGKLLLPGSRIRWDIHYHAIGEPIRDHVELAIYLYPKGETPKYRTRLTLFPATAMGGVYDLDIPPHSVAETQRVTTLRSPARLENYQPHMHLRGKAMTMEAILPDGTVRMISSVSKFNFNWMNNYIYTDEAAPVLPKGTQIRIRAWHDNTTANPNNPDPNQWVGFGDRTIDEMAHAWVNVTNISEEDYQSWVAKQKKVSASSRTQ